MDNTLKDWENYETYAINRLRLILGEEQYLYFYKGEQETKIYDSIAQKAREIDGLTIHIISRRQAVVQAKHYTRKVDLSEVESFILFCQDLDAHGIFISTKDFTKSMHNKALYHGIELLTFSKDEFEQDTALLSLIPLYFIDGVVYNPTMKQSLLALIYGEYEKANDYLLDVPYEEWLYVVGIGFQSETTITATINWLQHIALHHYADDWRFCAIQELSNHHQLSPTFVLQILLRETDPEIIAFLQEG